MKDNTESCSHRREPMGTNVAYTKNKMENERKQTKGRTGRSGDDVRE